MGKLFALFVLVAGAMYLRRGQKTTHCPRCDRTVRSEAMTCVHCGETLRTEGPTIDVDAR